MQAIRLKVGTSVGRYELLRCIGHGGMGVVYEAVDRSLGRTVAVKILNLSIEDGAHSKRAAARFLREGRVAARVRHPHVVDVYDFGVERGLPFLVMEYVDGESLSRLLERRTKLSLEHAVDLLLPILSAVAELHAAGVIHRDIKPANILLARGENPCPKLADFGVSRLDDGSPSITRSGATIGTPEYMAPELIRAPGPASEKSDQYALGVTLYECTTGKKPFRGATEYELMHAVVSESPWPPSTQDPSLPRAFDDLVTEAMHHDPGRRFFSIDELAEALLPFASPSAAMKWRHEFIPAGATSDYAQAAQQTIQLIGKAIVKRTGRAAIVTGVAVGAALLATSATGGLFAHVASATADRSPQPAVSPLAPDPFVPTARTPMPWAAVASPNPQPASTRGTPSASTRPLVGPPARKRDSAHTAGTVLPAETAASEIVPSVPTLGDNRAPILDVP